MWTEINAQIIWICSNLQPSWYWSMLIPNRLMHCQRRLSFPLPLPTSSSSSMLSSTSLVVIDLDSVAVHEIGHSSMVMALDQYVLGAIVISIFALVVAIYSFVAMKKMVVGEVQIEVVNCVATATAAANEGCRSANATDADVIIVNFGNANPSNSLSFLFLFFLSRQPNSALSISFFFFFFFFELRKIY